MARNNAFQVAVVRNAAPARLRITLDMTLSVMMDQQIRGRTLHALSRFSRFGPDDEHNRGVFIFVGFAFEWRIEYRAIDGVGRSPNPADPIKTLRVLTVYVVADVLG